MNRRGFTLIEVLFVTGLVAVLLASASPYLRSFHTSWQSVSRRSEVIQNARVGMDKMVRELRQAGRFSSLGNSTVTFSDVDNNSINYRLSAGNLERNNAVLAGPVDSLAFTYYDAGGAETDVPADVKSVEISLTVADAEGAANSLSFLATAFMRSTAGVTGEGYLFSKNSDFSTEDTVFSASDTFYIKVWSDEVDYNNLDYADCELKKGGTRVNFNLTNNGDGIYTASRSLSGFSTGSWTVNIDVKDNNHPPERYKPSPSPRITITRIFQPFPRRRGRD
jgi:prepilin-type N-terminal cleavage/methylation domain-containing protein